jgi:D-apionate oxidoisomerase
MKVCVLGAAGKMGTRISESLRGRDPYELLLVESRGPGEARLRERGDAPTDLQEAMPAADVVIMAVPDRLVARVASEAVEKMKSGAMLVCLDPAAPHAGRIPPRADISVFVCHPAHPSVFNSERDLEARFDFFGSGKAAQPVVCALMRGPEGHYAVGERLAMTMWRPVTRAHRISVEQMAILEPALAETLAATCISVIREGLDEAVRRGVPEPAARDFLLGHIFCELGILFDQTPFPFSDGAKQAIAEAMPIIFKPDWKQRVFDPDEIRASCGRIAPL